MDKRLPVFSSSFQKKEKFKKSSRPTGLSWWALIEKTIAGKIAGILTPGKFALLIRDNNAKMFHVTKN